MALFINQNGQTVGASDSRIVFLYNDGMRQVIPTTAPTVGVLLSRLGIIVNPGDVVEPAADTPILQNNFQINIYRVHSVTVVEDGIKKVVETATNDPRAIAELAGYTIYPQDYVSNANDADNLSQGVLGDEVNINPATPIDLNLYGSNVVVRTHATTVAGLLSSEQIKTNAGNNVLPALTTPITPNLQILVVPVGQKLISTQQAIPFPTQNVADTAIAFGTSTVEQDGINGMELVVEDISANGAVSALPQQTVVIDQPTPEIIGHGTGAVAYAGGNNISWLKSSDIPADDYGYASYIISHESNWNPDAVNFRGCIGLGQSCSGELAVVCPDWQTDAVCQLDFFNAYVVEHGYGSWLNAAIFWQDNHYW